MTLRLTEVVPNEANPPTLLDVLRSAPTPPRMEKGIDTPDGDGEWDWADDLDGFAQDYCDWYMTLECHLKALELGLAQMEKVK